MATNALRRAAVGLCGSALLIGYLISTSLGSESNSLVTSVVFTDYTTRSTSDANRAAAVGGRAAAVAGLTDRDGPFFDYVRVAEVTNSSWDALFDNLACVQTSCSMDARLRLRIEQAADVFKITEVEGPVDEEQRTILLAYTEQDPQTQPGWRFPAAKIDGTSGRIEGSPVWDGPPEALGTGSKCAPRISSASGQELWRGEPLDLGPPPKEADRAGDYVSFSAVPAEFRSGSPSVSCETWRGRGWVPGAPPQAREHQRERPDGTEAGYIVSAQLTWEGPAFVQSFTQCTIRLRDSAGGVVASTTETFVSPPPQPGSERAAFTSHSFARFAAAPSGSATEAEVECEPINAQDFERGDA